MKIFIDTANLVELREAAKPGVLGEVTTTLNVEISGVIQGNSRRIIETRIGGSASVSTVLVVASYCANDTIVPVYFSNTVIISICNQ